MGMSQMCTGAGDYFRTSKPHSEKLWIPIKHIVVCMLWLLHYVHLKSFYLYFRQIWGVYITLPTSQQAEDGGEQRCGRRQEGAGEEAADRDCQLVLPRQGGWRPPRLRLDHHQLQPEDQRRAKQWVLWVISRAWNNTRTFTITDNAHTRARMVSGRVIEMTTSVVTNIRIRIRIRIFFSESRIFGFGFVIFARRIIFRFGFVIESLPSNLNLFNFWLFYQNFKMQNLLWSIIMSFLKG